MPPCPERDGSELAGVAVVDKPTGMSSFDVVRKIKRILGGLRVGHVGTLDPLATGVLPVCVGAATRLIEFMDLEWKHYEGVLELGRITDTWDVTGRTIETRDVPYFPPEVLQERFAEFEGVCRQQVPAFSAVKVAGRPLYAYARRGKAMEAPVRDVVIRSFRLVRAEDRKVAFHLVCGTGTYVRSLVHVLGSQLGCGACLASLRRIRNGCFRIEHARGLEELEAALAAGAGSEVLLPLERVLSHLEVVDVPPENERKALNGNPLSLREMGFSGEESPQGRVGNKVRIRVRGRLVGVGEFRKDKDGYHLQPIRMIEGGWPWWDRAADVQGRSDRNEY